MRKLLCLFLLVACELKPAPQKEPEPAPVAPAPPPEPTPKPVEPAAGSAVPTPPKIEISEPCMRVAAHIASVIVSNAADAAQKVVYEQERGNMVRKTGEACTVQGWSEPARTCYLGTKTPAELKACEQKFPPQPPVRGT